VNIRVNGFRSLHLGENRTTGELFYFYLSNIIGNNRIEITTPIDNSIVLQPYIKRNYKSYEYTDKKKGISKKKVVLYNPTYLPQIM